MSVIQASHPHLTSPIEGEGLTLVWDIDLHSLSCTFNLDAIALSLRGILIWLIVPFHTFVLSVSKYERTAQHEPFDELRASHNIQTVFGDIPISLVGASLNPFRLTRDILVSETDHRTKTNWHKRPGNTPEVMRGCSIAPCIHY